MATFNINSSVNWDDSSFSTRAANDTYNINGVTLTIDTDTRYSKNATSTTGNLGPVTISSTLGGKLLIDGSKVRLIAYNSGSGNVPAKGTTITNVSGGITGELIGVWSALNAAPTAAAAAMPAAGYIKIKNATGSFTSGALSGIGATSTGADVVGWIEVVGVDGSTLTCPRLGSTEITGEWFEVGTTNNTANQTIQMPASLTNTYYPGVWIETAVGSGTYEFYPNAGSATTVFATDSVRGKVVWVSAQGSLIISKTSFGGYLPVTGLKIRVPNVLLTTCTSGAPTTNSYNATATSRYKFDTSSGGVVSISKCVSTWYNSFSTVYSLTLSYVGFLDTFVVSNIGSAFTWTNIGVGIGTNVNVSTYVQWNTSFYGGTITDSVFARFQYVSGQVSMALSGVFGVTWTNCKFLSLTTRSGSAGAIGFSQFAGTNTVFTNCTMIGGFLQFTSVTNMTVTNFSYCDLITGATTSANPLNAFIVLRSNIVTIDGFNFAGQTNAHPYDGMISSKDTDRLTIRNIGTAASPLSLGSANACNVVFGSASNFGNLTNFRMQRIYTTNSRAGSISLQVIQDSGITMESCWDSAANTLPIGSNNVIYKGSYAGGALPTAFTTVYGTHFFDTFSSSTAGKIGIFMNEASTSTSSYVTTSLSAGSGFTATGTLVLATTNDYVEWTWPHYVLGYTAFTASSPTVTGTNSTSKHKYQYKIDKNDTNGFNASYRNFYYQRTGGATTNTSPIITMTSTTDVSVGDYVFGTNIGTNAKVVTVDSSTQCTLSVNSTGTAGSLTFVFSQLPNETSISASLGFKLKIKAICTSTDTTNTITGCSCTGTTDAVSQKTQYPLDLVPITITVQNSLNVPIENARVAIYKVSDNTELMNALTNSSGIATINVEYLSNTTVYIRVRKSSTGTRYLNNDSAGTINSLGLTSTITMITDSVAT